MISVEKAKQLILKNTVSLALSTANLSDSLGSVLADNVISPVHLPLFDQSAMDGFAILFSDYRNRKNIKLVGEVAAGKVFKDKLTPGQAVRIFTGAAVPAGADTVIVQEKATLKNEFLIINDKDLKQSANIRKAGSLIKKGKIALPKGTTMTPGGIGYLAGMGITAVNLISKPHITVIVTGTELVKPGRLLTKGQIHESNSFLLKAALQSLGLKPKKIVSLKDSEAKTIRILSKAITNSDLVLITGGISVGKYDFVGRALQQLGVENIFYKVKQKPGKPIFFGKRERTLIFGLPGNPAAVLSCFYEYVYPALRIMEGNKNPFLKIIQLPVARDYSKRQGLSFFLKGKISRDTVIPLEGQESNALSSFALADCHIYLPEECENIKKGELVEVHELPGLY